MYTGAVIRSAYLAARPEDAGIDSERLEAVFARAKRDIDDGVLPGCQVAVARQGRVAGMRTFGSAEQGGVEKPATDGTLYCFFSSTKAVVAAGVWLLFEDGLLRLEERVADIIPEFGTNGKDVITVEQVLTHTAGFPYAPFRGTQWADRAARLGQFAMWRLNWEPGSRYEYHATSAHWVLAEIIERRTKTDFRDYIRARVTGPMGLDELYLGLPAEHDGRFAKIRYMSEPVEPPGGYGEVTPQAVLGFNEPELWRVGVPGAGAITSAGEMALFYQVLVNGGETVDGRRVIKPETIEFATAVRTDERHHDFMGTPVNRALSVVVSGPGESAYLRGFGRVLGPRAFGHGGAGGQTAWGDPDTGISLGYCTNGFVDYITLGRRVTALSSLAAGCAIEAAPPK